MCSTWVSDDTFLYCSSVQDIKHMGVVYFKKHWAKGEPVLVEQVCDGSAGFPWLYATPKKFMNLLMRGLIMIVE